MQDLCLCQDWPDLECEIMGFLVIPHYSQLQETLCDNLNIPASPSLDLNQYAPRTAN